MVNDRFLAPHLISGLSVALALVAPGTACRAADQEYLFTRILYEYQHTGYSGTQSKDSLIGDGIILFADLLDYGGLIVGKGNKKISSRDDALRTDEQSTYYSGHVNFSVDQLAGTVALRLESIQLRDVNSVRTRYFDGSSERRRTDDDIECRSLLLSYLSYRKDVYADIAYSSTRLRAQDVLIEDLDVSQVSPALGAGFNNGYDWMQARAFIIDHGDSNRITGDHHSDGYQFKWTHWWQATKYYPNNSQVGLRTGKALMSVDYDAGAVYTVADVLTRAWSLSATWKLNQSVHALLFAGWEHYITTDGRDNYDGHTLYTNVSVLW